MTRKKTSKITLAPPFKAVRTKLQGHRTIVVKQEKNAIIVNKTSDEPAVKADEDGYIRERVHDSWEY